MFAFHYFFSNRVSWAEESALTDLKNKIGAYSTELKREFQSLDPTNTGNVYFSY